MNKLAIIFVGIIFNGGQLLAANSIPHSPTAKITSSEQKAVKNSPKKVKRYKYIKDFSHDDKIAMLATLGLLTSLVIVFNNTHSSEMSLKDRETEARIHLYDSVTSALSRGSKNW